jgi:hypothetical protein
VRLVILESPYAGDVEANIAYAKKCIHDCLTKGEASIASHLLYTQSGILDDTKPEERKLGIEAGHAWYRVAEACVVYCDRGVSKGMTLGTEIAYKHGVPIEYRYIADKPEFTGNTSDIKFQIGKRYLNRAGAVIEITKINDFPGYNWLIGRVVRSPDGVEVPPEANRIVTFGPDGRYSPVTKMDIDLVREVEEVLAK